MSEHFDWTRDCGGYISPAEAAQQARDAGQTYQEYAEEYLASWPHDDAPPADLVPGMVAAMEAPERTEPLPTVWGEAFDDTDRPCTKGTTVGIEAITLDQFGPTNRFDAAHIINDDDNHVYATVLEPENRARARSGEYGSQVPEWDEEAFRNAVRAIVRDMDPGTWIVQFDPGRGPVIEEVEN